MNVILKRVCILLLVVSMLCIPISFAEESNSSSDLTTGEIGLLKTVGIITDNAGNYQAEMSRGEAAYVIAKLYNVHIAETEEESLFYDVGTDHPYNQYISALAKMDVIHGHDDGSFRPNDAITYNEACKLFTHVLGYGNIENLISYADAARMAGINDNVKTTSKLSRGQMFKLAYNTLHSGMLKHKISGASFSLEIDEDNLAIEVYHGLRPCKGIVDVVYGTNLTHPDSSCEEEEFCVDGVKYSYPGAEALLGRSVVFYVYSADIKNESRIPQVQYLYEDEKKNEILKIDASQIVDFSSRKFIYYPDESSSKTKVVDVVPEMDVIYNGVAHPSFSDDDFKPYIGNVTFIDNNRDRQYDVVIIESYKTMVVNAVNPEKQIIYGKYGISKLGSENVNLRITKRDSKAMITALKENSVIAVKESLNTSGDKYISIMILSKDTEGSVNRLSDDKIKVGNMEYELAKNYLKDETVRISDYVEIYTVDGKAAVVLHTSEENWRVGYVVKANTYDDDFDDEKQLYITLIDTSKEKKRYEAIKNVRVDGRVFKDKDDALTQLGNAAANTYTSASYEYSQLIKYKVNDDGMLTHIDTNIYDPANETESSLRMDVQSLNLGNNTVVRKHSTAYKALYEKEDEEFTKFVCTTPEDAANLWLVPKVNRDTEQWYSNTWSRGEYPCEVYNLDPESLRAEYIVGYQSDIVSVDVGSYYWIVTDIWFELDDEDEVVRRISLIGNGTKERILDSRLDGEDIGIGDIIQIREGINSLSNERIEYIKKIYSNGSVVGDRILSAGGNVVGYGDLEAAVRIAYGTALSNKDGVITHTTSRPDDIAGLEARENLNNYLVLSNTYFYLFDTTNRTPEVKSATVNDIITSVADPENPDEVFVFTTSGTLRFVYIVRK